MAAFMSITMMNPATALHHYAGHNSLRRMQREGAHLALATDEGGRPYGIVTLEDMLEELVGQIRDNSRASRTAAPTTA